MSSTEERTNELLFTYGTLQLEAVQRETFGRTLKGMRDVLVGYRVAMIEIQDPDFIAKNGPSPQRTLEHTGRDSDVVEGTVLELTKAELEQADTYEPAEYKRNLVRLKSGTKAWVYLVDPESDR